MEQNRRRFLWTLVGGGGWLFGNKLARLSDGDEPRLKSADPARLQTVKKSSTALGSHIAITAVHADKKVAIEAIDAAFDAIERIETVMSLYRPDSQLSQLNRDGRLTQPDARLVEILRIAEKTSRSSDGAFDITVQPLWLLFREAQQAGSVPSADAIRAARATINYRRVQIREDGIRFNGSGTLVTLNGIAQGYALDCAAKVLVANHVHSAMIDTGEIGASGMRADGSPWRVGIQHPRHEDAYAAVCALDGRCLATSGDYATTFSKDYASNHLFDPQTGRSPTEVASVSVLAPSGVLADSLSTAIAVWGVARGRALLARTQNADAFFVLKSGRTLATPGFPMKSV